MPTFHLQVQKIKQPGNVKIGREFDNCSIMSHCIILQMKKQDQKRVNVTSQITQSQKANSESKFLNAGPEALSSG